MKLDLPWAARALRQLLGEGHVADAQGQLRPVLTGHAHPVSGGWVVSQPLLQRRSRLGSNEELVMALLAQEPALRASWLRIAAARCLEAGQLADEQSLLDAVTQLGPAAGWVEAVLAEASLAETTTTTLEHELLGAGADQALAVPALRRALATAHALETQAGAPLPALPIVDPSGLRAAENWSAGRLLVLPASRVTTRYLLQGAGDRDVTVEGDLAESAAPVLQESPPPKAFRTRPDSETARPSSEQTLHWLFANPWSFLLALVVYAQDAWAAECRGGLQLELPQGQAAHTPGEITVTVQSADGAEAACGSLADLLLRTLDHLGMACFPARPSAAVLNLQLAPLVGSLLARRVWRFVEAASGARGQYQIHPEFADAAYRMLGSKVIRRGAERVWRAVKIQAEEMRAQELVQARAAHTKADGSSSKWQAIPQP